MCPSKRPADNTPIRDASGGRPVRSGERGLVPFKTAFLYWLRLGFINFGGPAGQIAIMQDELVDRRRWISQSRFLHALNYCMLLPGPEAQQLAIYIGWLLNGTLGGIVAGVFFVLPAFFLILGLSWTFAVHGDVGWVAAVFYGLEAAVVAIVLAALIRVGSRALRTPMLLAIAVGSFAAIFLLRVPFPVIIVAAGLLGFLGARMRPGLFPATHGEGETDDDAVIGDTALARVRLPTLRRALLIAAVGVVAWWGPLLAVVVLRGTDDTLSKEALFFSQAAMVTFGGAYAVLSYINQAAVQHFGWLQPGEMVTGLGLAESTPGPLIMVTEFVGFVAAYRFPGGLDPVLAGTLGAAVTVWATFAPCFLWIFLGAPYIERLRGHRALNSALASITAAVVGVIANLAVIFAIFALFSSVTETRVWFMTLPSPRPASLDGFAALLAGLSFVGIWRYKLNVVWVVSGCALAGLIFRALT